MKQLVLLTGKPRTGKSTVFGRFVSAYSSHESVFYVLSKEIRENGQRTGFEVVTSEYMEPRVFDKRGQDGKYQFDQDVWGDIASQLRRNANKVVILDEIGPMQLSCADFKDAVFEVLQTDLGCMFATIALMSDKDGWIDQLKQYSGATLHELTEENRDAIHDQLNERLLRLLR